MPWKARAAEWLRAYPGVPVRRRVARGDDRLARVLPARVRRVMELDGIVCIDGVRVELGSGPYPTPGYIHVDIDRRSLHLEHVALLWDLPFADHTVEEMLAVHVLEHVHPAMIDRTLAEWRRVLGPGATLRIHVPNTPAITRAFNEASIERKWALSAAIYGMNIGPDAASAPAKFDVVDNAPDHKVMYDAPLLRWVLEGAGFVDFDDLTGRVSDRITDDWAHVVPELSLIVTVRSPEA